MADKKISQLTTLAQADVAVTADFLPIVDTSATETKKATPQALVQAGATGATLAPAALSISGGTASGVLYLNGSKVATSGSALTYNGTGLGVGVASASFALDVGGADGTNIALRSTGTSSARFRAYVNGAESGVIGFLNGGGQFFEVAGSEAMRLTTTGLGIGTASPATRLDVQGPFSVESSIRLTSPIDGSAVTPAGSFFSFRSGSALRETGRISSLNEFANFNGGNLVFSTSDSSNVLQQRAVIDRSGNLGIGTVSPAQKLHVVGNAYRQNDASNSYGFTISTTSGTTTLATLFGGSSFGIQTNGSGVNNLFLNSSGNLSLAEGNAPTQILSLYRAGSTNAIMSAGNSNTGLDGTWFGVDTAGNGIVNVRGAFPLLFSTSANERARITSGGYFKASNDGSYANSTAAYHELRTSAADYVAVTSNSNASPYGAYFWFSAADPNNTTNLFLLCNGWNGSANVTRATIRSNGGIANYQANDVNLSDERVKTDIAPLGSMWAKFKALEIVTFKYKDQTHDDDNIGVIAQQVESVAPEFVDADGWGETPEDGVPLKSIYTADMYHAAIKALQEAMARIEKLEAEVAAFKGA